MASTYDYHVISMNEEFYEEALIQYLCDNLNWTHLYGPDVLRSSEKFQDAFMCEELPASLKRINKGMPQAAIDEAIYKISNIDAGSLAQRN